MLTIRSAELVDWEYVWSFLQPVIQAGEVYTLDREMTQEQAFSYWFGSSHRVFIAEQHGQILGSYYLRANQQGGGAHVCNCGYATATWARGRGVAAAMCAHSLQFAKSVGFQAMQFNFVVASNQPAVYLWRKLGFEIVGTLPHAFQHPRLGFVDAFVMWQNLSEANAG